MLRERNNTSRVIRGQSHMRWLRKERWSASGSARVHMGLLSSVRDMRRRRTFSTKMRQVKLISPSCRMRKMQPYQIMRRLRRTAVAMEGCGKTIKTNAAAVALRLIVWSGGSDSMAG